MMCRTPLSLFSCLAVAYRDTELFGDFPESLIVCGLDRDDNGLGVAVLHQPFNADLANHLIVLLFTIAANSAATFLRPFCGKLRCDLGGFQPLLDHQIGHFAAYFHRSCLPLSSFCFLALGLFFNLPCELDLLLKLRDMLRYLLGTSQLPADRTQGKGDFLDLGAYIFAAPFAAVQLAPGNRKRVNVRLQSIRKHGQLTLAVDTIFCSSANCRLYWSSFLTSARTGNGTDLRRGRGGESKYK